MIKFSSIYIAHNYYKTTNDKEEGKKKNHCIGTASNSA